MITFRHMMKQIVPPVFLSGLRSVFPAKQDDNVFEGNFASWKDALNHTMGYHHPAILEKVKQANKALG